MKQRLVPVLLYLWPEKLKMNKFPEPVKTTKTHCSGCGTVLNEYNRQYRCERCKKFGCGVCLYWTVDEELLCRSDAFPNEK